MIFIVKVLFMEKTMHPDETCLALFAKVKMLALDCDGVLTDGTILTGYNPRDGEIELSTGIEFAKFSHRDG